MPRALLEAAFPNILLLPGPVRSPIGPLGLGKALLPALCAVYGALEPDKAHHRMGAGSELSLPEHSLSV